MKLSEFLCQRYQVPMPEWLRLVERDAPDAKRVCQLFLSSRLVFYPGSGFDGGPIAAFNRAHAAHCYVYVDYDVSRQELEDRIRDGFRGYASLTRIEVSQSDLVDRWVPHDQRARGARTISPARPSGFIEVFERNADLQDTHGAERFAVLFLLADAYDAFNALFVHERAFPAPFCVVVEDHAFGGNYDSFGRGGILERLAQKADAQPSLLLAGSQKIVWDGFMRCPAEPEKMGMHGTERALYARATKAAS